MELFRNTYFPASAEGERSETDTLLKLRKLCDVLQADKSNADVGVLKEIAAILTSKDGISTHEFIRSGIVSGVLSYLSSSSLEQLKLFGHNFDKEALTVFIQECINSMNKDGSFPITLNPVRGSDSGLGYLAQPFKITVARADGEKRVYNLGSLINVVVEPLSSVRTIARFVAGKLRSLREALVEAKEEERLAKEEAEKKALEESKDKEEKGDAMDVDNKEEKEAGKGDAMDVDGEKDADAKGKEEASDEDEAEEKEAYKPGIWRWNNEGSWSLYDNVTTEILENAFKEGSDTVELSHGFFARDGYTANLKTMQQINNRTRYNRKMQRVPQDDLRMLSMTTVQIEAFDDSSDEEEVEDALGEINIPEDDVDPDECLDQDPKLADKLSIYLNGRLLAKNLTLFQAILQDMQRKDKSVSQGDDHLVITSSEISQCWRTTHKLEYKIRDDEKDEKSLEDSSEIPLHVERMDKIQVNFCGIEGASVNTDKALEKVLKSKISFPTTENTAKVLLLLKILHACNARPTLWPNDVSPLDSSIFLSPKLSSSLTRQVSDPLLLCASSLPSWCRKVVKHCPFLFQFNTRNFFFKATSSGIQRGVMHAIEMRQPNVSLKFSPMTKQKVRIIREKALESAQKVMALCAENPNAILEVEFRDEVGTGLGPTCEFYTLASHEIQRRDLSLWVDAENNKEKYVISKHGLFPKPLNPKEATDAVKTLIDHHFTFLGTFVAKAILDGRLLDLPFSTGFLKAILGIQLSMDDLTAMMSAHQADILKQLSAVALQVKEIKEDEELSDKVKQGKIDKLRYHGGKIKDMELEFVVPGHENWALKDNGEEIVTIDNLCEYLDLLFDALVKSGIEKQVNAFRKGFNEIFAIQHLQAFSIPELQVLLCGADETQNEEWAKQVIADNISVGSGYSSTSNAVKFLVEILSELTPKERKLFVRFLTGSVRLPIGGFKSLNPKLTIVRKDCFPSDQYLPSVNTCFYYLKLPDYSSKIIMKQRLLQAVENAQTCFTMS